MQGTYNEIKKVTTMKRNLFLFVLFFLLFYLFAMPSQALEASRSGLGLWLNTLLPTLLPFLILSRLLLRTGVIRIFLEPLAPVWRSVLGLTPYGAYAWILGMLCGYPMGAKLAGELYCSGKITRNEADYLLTFCNNASPMFLSTYLVHTVLGRPEYTLITFLLLYCSMYLCSLCFRVYYRRFSQSCLLAMSRSGTCDPASAPAGQKKETSSLVPERDWIDVSIMDSFETITKLGGYILLFSIFSAAIQTIWTTESISRTLFLSLTEISTGLHHIQNTGLNFPLKYAIATAASSFGGLCILAQTRSVTHSCGLSLLPYLAGKLLNFCLTFLLALLVSQVIQ